jgi:hypothetical protein
MSAINLQRKIIFDIYFTKNCTVMKKYLPDTNLSKLIDDIFFSPYNENIMSRERLGIIIKSHDDSVFINIVDSQLYSCLSDMNLSFDQTYLVEIYDTTFFFSDRAINIIKSVSLLIIMLINNIFGMTFWTNFLWIVHFLIKFIITIFAHPIEKKNHLVNIISDLILNLVVFVIVAIDSPQNLMTNIIAPKFVYLLFFFFHYNQICMLTTYINNYDESYEKTIQKLKINMFYLMRYPFVFCEIMSMGMIIAINPSIYQIIYFIVQTRDLIRTFGYNFLKY